MSERDEIMAGLVLLDEWQVSVYVPATLADTIAEEVRETVVVAFTHCAEEVTEPGRVLEGFVVLVWGWGMPERNRQ